MVDPLSLLLVLVPALPLASALLTALVGAALSRARGGAAVPSAEPGGHPGGDEEHGGHGEHGSGGGGHAGHGPAWIGLFTILAILGSFVCSVLIARNVYVNSSASAAHAGDHEDEVSGAESPESRLAVDGPAAGGYERVFTLWTWAVVPDAYAAPAAAVSAPWSVTDEESPTGIERVLRDFRIEIALRADGLTAIMLVMVTFVSLMVAIYATGYMSHDPGKWRFFSYVSLFVFSMTMLVSVSNFVLLYVFWEAVGVCSYLLIGFWYQRPAAAAAGKKAFLVNRVGDFGFALGLFLIWTTYGTLNYHSPSAATPFLPAASSLPAAAAATAAGGPAADESGPLRAKPEAPAGVLSPERIESGDYVGMDNSPGGSWTATAICLLLLVGACGKSAQFPLHVWLPDAMEGPTPVSALIHAATMVTSGIYMITRCTPLFMASPEAQLVVAIVGGFTALLAALIAITQNDLKRVLAYSTVSQLGYMFLGLGTGTLLGASAGMFHLFTHAFFKALLFLGAGSVMHAMGDVIDMRRFGGLRRLLPITHATFLLGCLALAGFPPLAGFWSKDSVLAAVHEKVHDLEHFGDDHAEDTHAGPGEARTRTAASLVGPTLRERGAVVYRVLYYSALLTSLLTAFYTFRAYFMTFHGPERVPPEAAGHAHESPPSMWGPLAVLAVFAVGIGLIFELQIPFTHHLFTRFLADTPSLAAGLVTTTTAPGELHFDIMAISAVIAISGIGLAAFLYLGERSEVDGLTKLMQGEWLAGLTDVQAAERWTKVAWIAAIERAARRAGLGWLTALLGRAFLTLTLFFAAPLMLARYLSPYRLSQRKFFFDEIYDFFIVRPLRLLAKLSYAFDRGVIDRLVNACGYVPAALGSLLRAMQTGLVQFYALAMVLGVLMLLAVRLLWTAS